MKTEAFIELVKTNCRHHDVKFFMPPSKTVKFSDGAMTAGYFNEDTLAVAGGLEPKRLVLETLVHEYCHMQQWLDKDPVSKATDDYFFEWLMRERELTPAAVEAAQRSTAGFEWDCERRALRMVKDYELRIDPKRYARGANAYIMSHAWMRKHRAWPKRNAYRFKGVLDQMVDTEILPLDDLLNPSEDQMKLLEKYMRPVSRCK